MAVVQSAIINGVFNLARGVDQRRQPTQSGRCYPDRVAGHSDRTTNTSLCSIGPRYLFAIVAATAKGITVVEAAGNGRREFRSGHLQQHRPAKRQRRDRGGRGSAADPIISTLTAAAAPVTAFPVRRPALAHFLFQLRQDRQRARLGLARRHARLWRRAGRRFREQMVHAAFLRNVQRFADCHRRGRMSAGTSQG